MNFFRKLFKPKVKYPEWDIHQLEMFNDIPYFYERIKETDEFDKRDIYYYREEASKLKSLIINKDLYGENSINDISLEFITVGQNDVKNKRIVFESALFYSDTLKMIKNYNPYFNFIYKRDNGNIVVLNTVLIAKDAIYFCSK